MNERGDEREDKGAAEQADRMEERAHQMDERSEQLERDIDATRRGWESRKGEEGVPGAQDDLDPAETGEGRDVEAPGDR